MRRGDQAIFYHSSTNPPGAAGICKIVNEAEPDPSQFDPTAKYYDPASKPDDPRWDIVTVAPVRKLHFVLPRRAASDARTCQLAPAGERQSAVRAAIARRGVRRHRRCRLSPAVTQPVVPAAVSDVDPGVDVAVGRPYWRSRRRSSVELSTITSWIGRAGPRSTESAPCPALFGVSPSVVSTTNRAEGWAVLSAAALPSALHNVSVRRKPGRLEHEATGDVEEPSRPPDRSPRKSTSTPSGSLTLVRISANEHCSSTRCGRGLSPTDPHEVLEPGSPPRRHPPHPPTAPHAETRATRRSAGVPAQRRLAACAAPTYC